jgi:uncharacterized protein YndB with AHSA1/START domain
VTADRELTITRVFDAPRDLVFKAWTELERLAQWWGPEGFALPFLELDMRPGGAWRACMRGPDGTNYWQHGVCRELVPPERLVYTLIWDSDPEHEMLVTVVFVERGQKTEMTFRQRLFKSVESRDSHRDGWSSSLNRLAAYLAS